MDTFLPIVSRLFIIMDPIGLIPVIHGLLKGFSPEERRRIMLRELVFALLILLLFFLTGDFLMQFLGLDLATLRLSGSVLLFLVALGMVFPALAVTGGGKEGGKVDPFIVPIAVPLISGPSCIAMIMVYAAQAPEIKDKIVTGSAIFSAWVLCVIVLMLSQFFMRFLGQKGMGALERLMGMLLILISIQMFLDGLSDYGSH